MWWWWIESLERSLWLIVLQVSRTRILALDRTFKNVRFILERADYLLLLRWRIVILTGDFRLLSLTVCILSAVIAKDRSYIPVWWLVFLITTTTTISTCNSICCSMIIRWFPPYYDILLFKAIILLMQLLLFLWRRLRILLSQIAVLLSLGVRWIMLLSFNNVLLLR